MAVIKLDFSQVTIYRVNLQKGETTVLELEDLKKEFEWVKGRTVVYFSPEEYFMRTQILATMLGEEFAFLDERPPSLRMLELFWITGQTPPPPMEINEHCFVPVLELYKSFYEKARADIEKR